MKIETLQTRLDKYGVTLNEKKAALDKVVASGKDTTKATAAVVKTQEAYDKVVLQLQDKQKELQEAKDSI